MISAKKKQETATPTPATWRPLQMHRSLLLDMVTQQTNSFEKATMELVMNAIDSGAKSIGIRLTNQILSVTDDGCGMPDSEEEMLYCFQQAGSPHALDRHGHSTDATFGRFRVGRLQMLGWGCAKYRSGHWGLDLQVVDKDRNHVPAKDVERRHDVGFEQRHHPDRYAGTHVDVILDEPLEDFEIERITNQIAKWARWSTIPVWVNDQLVSTHPQEAKKDHWTIETPDAWMALEKDQYGRLEVYMHGIFVCSIYSSAYGASGTIVTKKQLLVDFGRQGISDQCPVWKAILGRVKGWAGAQLKDTKVRKNVTDIRAVWKAAREDDLEPYGGYDKFNTLPIFLGIDGFYKSWNQIGGLVKNGTLKPSPDGKFLLSLATKGDPRAAKIHDDGNAFVVNQAIFAELFHVTGSPLLSMVEKLVTGLVRSKAGIGLSWRALSEISPDTKSTYEMIAPIKLTSLQRTYLDMLQGIYRSTWWASKRMRASDPGQRRWMAMRFGNSSTAEAWTDGETYIAYDWKTFSEHLPLTVGSLQHFVAIIQHEMCHDTASFGTHQHSAEFYEDFHELQLETSGKVMNDLMLALSYRVTSAGGKDFKASSKRKFLDHLRTIMLGPKAIELWFGAERSSKAEASAAWETFVGQDVKALIEADRDSRKSDS